MAQNDDHGGISTIGTAKITDRFARNARKTIESISKHDSLSLVLYLVAVIAGIAARVLTGSQALVVLILGAALILHRQMIQRQVERERNEILREQAALAQRRPMQLHFPAPTDPPSQGAENDHK
jgi:hypothetical protein